jgi:Methyltransferase domain
MVMGDFTAFVLSQLPPAPARVLEVGCGEKGGVTPHLVEEGYEVLAIDPEAPAGPAYRQITLEELEDPGPFAAVVAGRVLHHVHPLEPALDKLAALAPLLVLDEFAPERIDEAAQGWYERQHRALRAAGQEPLGPSDLDEWRERHQDLHPSHVLLAALRARFDELAYEDRPYLYRWLRGVATEGLEETLVATGAIQPIGWRWSGKSRSCVQPVERADRQMGVRAR